MLTGPFNKILIANRGEIAVRIIRAARDLGIPTVAVYSDVDRTALHVRYADEAVHIGGPRPAESYLRKEKLIEVARKTGADAIHPGYGFLAENADFAQQVIDAGLIWIGPSPSAIATMGDKQAARTAVRRNKVPLIPGTEPGMPDDELVHAARRIGFPVLIKAVAGGGGKGMRPVQREEDFAQALATARREAESAFGNGDVYVEKLLQGARHIEFQILADAHGNTVHLGERECSIQRRHQKLVEEAPSVFVDRDLRERMGAMAIAAAESVGYVNAGTIECLVDRNKNFYFLEMNTRLQVEHPVTELVTGVDLAKGANPHRARSAHGTYGEPAGAEGLGDRMSHQCRRSLRQFYAIDRADQYHDFADGAGCPRRQRRLYRRGDHALLRRLDREADYMGRDALGGDAAHAAGAR